MITCKTCSTTFAKPVRRGRPPSQCDSCKGGKAAETPSERSGGTSTPAKASKALSEPLRAGKKGPRAYVSGFCNPRHAPDIHKLCSTIGNCACGCHT